jgi:outer membrane protein
MAGGFCFPFPMRNILRTVFPAVLLMTLLGGAALAQSSKVATADLRKLFDNYWKTKQAQAAILDRVNQLTKDDNSMKDDFKKAGDDYQQLLAQANDQAISADERDRRKQAAADKLKQLEDRRTAIAQSENDAQARLNAQRQRMREKILALIQTHVDAAAKAGGYTLVIDTAAETVNGTPTVIYHTGENDITDTVLKQLNAGAPIDLTATNSVPAVSSMPSLLNTNGP